MKYGLSDALNAYHPATVINLASSGGYPFQNDEAKITCTNVVLTAELAQWCAVNRARLIHMGSSSEYGTNSAGPAEDAECMPNSAYASSKLAATELLRGAENIWSRVLRLYSVYGPLEEPRRLVPEIIRRAKDKQLPDFADPDTSRDFVYIDDVVDAILTVAKSDLEEKDPFRIFNVATSRAVTMRNVASASQFVFGIRQDPVFSVMKRAWDLPSWYGNPARIKKDLGWKAQTAFYVGLRLTAAWYKEHPEFLNDSYSAARFEVSPS